LKEMEMMEVSNLGTASKKKVAKYVLEA
jgi:hypothetical protein